MPVRTNGRIIFCPPKFKIPNEGKGSQVRECAFVHKCDHVHYLWTTRIQGQLNSDYNLKSPSEEEVHQPMDVTALALAATGINQQKHRFRPHGRRSESANQSYQEWVFGAKCVNDVY
jgi:hypothetical protein